MCYPCGTAFCNLNKNIIFITFSFGRTHIYEQLREIISNELLFIPYIFEETVKNMSFDMFKTFRINYSLFINLNESGMLTIIIFRIIK